MTDPKNAPATASRRDVLIAAGALAIGTGLPLTAQAAAHKAKAPAVSAVMPPPPRFSYFLASDGARIFYKDWGSGQPIVFSHGWPLTADAWDSQMLALAEQGFRVIAHDRRGHGRSDQTWDGNDMDTYADDLATLINMLELQNAVLVGHSTGGGEVARYIGRHGTAHVSKAALIAAVPPVMLKSETNPEGVPLDIFDAMRDKVRSNRSQFFLDLAPSFFAVDSSDKASQGLIDSFWRQAMLGGIRGQYECIKQFSETDFTGDLKQMQIPTLLLHGEDDKIVPLADSSAKAAKILPKATLKTYPGAPHGLCSTHAEQVNADLLAFIKS